MSNLTPALMDPLPKPASPARPGGRHQIKRSITELASPVKLHRHHHQNSHHLHRRDRHNDDKNSLSPYAHITGRHSLDMPRSEGVSPMITPNLSRRPSVLAQDDRVKESKTNDTEELEKERKKASIRSEGLRQALAQLDTFSTDTTRRLDETYYEVLEKMSTLQNTVMALKDLAESSRDVYQGFEKDSRELEHDIVTQLGAAGHFDEQQARIGSLQNRVHGGQEQMQALVERVDVVRERIEGWECADREWQERTRKRLKIIWTVMSVLALVLIVLFLGIKYTYPDFKGPEPNMPNSTERVGSASWREASKRAQPAAEGSGGTGLLWKRHLDEGERLRMFDEL